MFARQILILAAVIFAASCGPGSTKRGLDSPVSAVRIQAIGKTAEQNDRSAIPRLVELLNSDDINVRFAAIGALQRMTGQDYGFEPADPASERRAAIDRWVAAVQSGEIPTIWSGTETSTGDADV